MSKISEKNINKIKEEILAILFENSLRALFSNVISNELARDNEFILRLLHELKKDGLVNCVDKNKYGRGYIKRKRWILSNKAYEAYGKLIG